MPSLIWTASYLKTHDFLRPLEQVETKSSAKEEATDEISSAVQKQPPLPTPASVEHLLPGGIGTYTISHINSYVNNTQRVPKPESSLFTVHQATSADRNDDSNCSSHTSSGFTLWEESEIKKGKTEKENNVGEKSIIGGNHEISIFLFCNIYSNCFLPLPHSAYTWTTLNRLWQCASPASHVLC